jgi:methylthioribulose 1-phosphate dehydratase/enolase-phosphatase E1
MSTEEEVRNLVCELCRNFYSSGWVTGTGGSISIRLNEKIFMTPSGVQKERIKPEELFVLDKTGAVLTPPSCRADGSRPKLSDCSPLFLHAYNQRDAGAVLHSHGMSCNLVTLLFAGSNEFRITKQEMIKGIDGHGYYDDLVIPIIENTAWEHELADSLGEAIAKYPKAPAVLVRQHGMYVWGKNWEGAKRHAECLHYLFDALLEANKLGLAHLIASTSTVHNGVVNNNRARKESTFPYTHVLVDIEGTVSPISFVKSRLFPFASEKVESFLEKNQNEPKVQDLISQLAVLAAASTETDSPRVSEGVAKIAEVAAFVRYLIAVDRKVTPLKTLQGLIWAEGYASGQLIAEIFPEVPSVLRKLAHDENVKLAVYSSGSRQAQSLLFRHTPMGDLTSLFTAFFDTKVGLKNDVSSYEEIALTLVGDIAQAGRILFITDVLAEAKAAKAAGMACVISVRAGNAVIEEEHDFKIITSFEQL